MKSIRLSLAAATAISLAACSSNIAEEPQAPATPESKVITYAPTKAASVKLYSDGVEIVEDAPVATPIYTEVKVVSDPFTEEVVMGYEQNFAQNEIKRILADENAEEARNFIYEAKEDTEVSVFQLTNWASYTHSLGVFYYNDEGECIKLPIGDLDPENKDYRTGVRDWQTKAYTRTGVGKVQIPKGTRFGFYLTTNGNDGKVYDRYSLNAKNEGGASYVCTFSREDGDNTYTYVSFEDENGPDYEDVIIRLDPKVAVKQLPDETTEEEIIEELKPEKPADVNPILDPALNHIEVNLALNDEKETGDWIESHLSVHVRAVSDFRIFMPVPAQYYCPADDMMIVAKHDMAYQYKESTATVDMEIAGNKVTFTCEYTEEGITVSSTGINESVMKYLNNKYSDGLTFEVKNYYNKEVVKSVDEATGEVWVETVPSITRADLKGYLDKSVIDMTPLTSYYVNAFGSIGDDPETEADESVLNPWASVVTLKEAAAYTPDTNEDNPLWNPYNTVFKKLTVEEKPQPEEE